MKDGFGNDRPAQVGACSYGEMHDALMSAQRLGVSDFVVVSHNFEMLRPDSSQPDWIVVRRFERLCAFLGQKSEQFCVRGFSNDLRLLTADKEPRPAPEAKWASTAQRYIEQVRRRLH